MDCPQLGSVSITYRTNRMQHLTLKRLEWGDKRCMGIKLNQLGAQIQVQWFVVVVIA